MDVDIDTPGSFDPLSIFDNWVRASVLQHGEMRSHPCGVYPQDIPVDPITGSSAIPYKEAEKFGVFKLDFLHLSVYNHFESREEIEALLKIEPNWDLLSSPSTVKGLFQLGNHYEILQQLKPRSIEDLGDVLALIRPGKRWMVDKYISDKQYVRKVLYKYKPDDQYVFKKSHSIAYALVIVLQLHLINLGLMI